MRFELKQDHHAVSVSGGETGAGRDCGGLVTLAVSDGGGTAVFSTESLGVMEAVADALKAACKAAREHLEEGP